MDADNSLSFAALGPPLAVGNNVAQREGASTVSINHPLATYLTEAGVTR